MSEIAKKSLLAVNAGSSSLKFELFEQHPTWRSHARGAVRDIGRARSSPVFELRSDRSRIERQVDIATHAEAATLMLDELLEAGKGLLGGVQGIGVTGHRIVHGGDRFTAPELVAPATMNQLKALAHLAPLHNPPAVAVLEAVCERLPSVPAVTVFDTAFFSQLPEHARRYAVPQSWHEQHGVKRFGFHGIAHACLSDRLQRLRAVGQPLRRVVTLHLGQGCSVAALENGRPVETSMGFTPLEGLIMGTRAGDIDGGAILHMARQGRPWHVLEEDLNRRSGLLGLSGVSDDVRELLALEDEGHAGARLALAAFSHRIRKYVGAYAAVLGGLDALVFGGGIGENSPRVRARICGGFGWLGLEIDDAANARSVGHQRRISTEDSTIEAHVIPVREEETIARSALACVESHDSSGSP